MEFRAFTFKGIPVHVSLWFLVLLIIVATGMGSVVAQLITVAAVAVSVLVHELGHAWMARRRNLRPSITLHGWGGLCQHHPPRTDRDDIIITAAGPAAGLVLGVGLLVVQLVLSSLGWLGSPVLGFTLGVLVWINLAWSLFNLVPMWPLDGGQIFQVVTRRRMPLMKSHQLTHRVGLGLAAAFALGALWLNQLFVFVIAAFLAWENWRRLQSEPRPIARHAGGMPSSFAAGGQQARAAFGISPVVKRLLLVNFAIWAAFVLLVEGAHQTWAAQAYSALALTPDEGLLGGHLWQLLGYMWLHDLTSIDHILWNSVGLWVLGSGLEERWGSRDFFRFYLIAGIGAGVLLSLLGVIAPGWFGMPVVGASGAIYAVLVARALVTPDHQFGLLLVIPIRAKHLFLAVVAIDTGLWLFNPDSDVAWHGHMAGIAMGWLLVTGNWRPRQLRDRYRLWRHERGKPKLSVIEGGRDGPTLH